jgi:hypothetical protein
MKTIFFTIICVSIFTGCVEPIEFHVDRNCSTEERWATIKAFEALNDVLGYEHAVVVGSETVDYDTVSEVGGGHIVMCIPDRDTAALFGAENYAGWYRDGTIGVRSDATMDRYGDWAFQRVLMHELVHLIGAKNAEHSNNPDDIFYTDFIPIESTDYTDSDKDIIRKYSILD